MWYPRRRAASCAVTWSLIFPLSIVYSLNIIPDYAGLVKHHFWPVPASYSCHFVTYIVTARLAPNVGLTPAMGKRVQPVLGASRRLKENWSMASLTLAECAHPRIVDAARALLSCRRARCTQGDQVGLWACEHPRPLAFGQWALTCYPSPR